MERSLTVQQISFKTDMGKSGNTFNSRTNKFKKQTWPREEISSTVENISSNGIEHFENVIILKVSMIFVSRKKF